MPSFFIAGTDTEVGKTEVTSALMLAYRGLGYSVAALKPVAAGAVQQADGWHNADVDQLLSHMTFDMPRDVVNPCCLPAAASPNIAARECRQSISAKALAAACQPGLNSQADICFVEGTGGWLCPISEQETMADLAVALGLPVIVVIGLRLGCLNHSLLTVQAIRQTGLPILACVANQITEDMKYARENVATLRAMTTLPVLTIPYDANPEPQQWVHYFKPEQLKALLSETVVA